MCRLLYVRADRPFELRPHLEGFAGVARQSREYQGHGWGLARLGPTGWEIHRSLTPVWEDDLGRFGRSTLLVAHARSAFQNRGICLENNMPFQAGPDVFVFNGELHGVKVRSPGRTGAEKIFHFIRRLDRGDLAAAVRKAMHILAARSSHIRAMNLIVGRPDALVLGSVFHEDPDYFTLHTRREPGRRLVCSDPYPGEPGWESVPGSTIEVLS